MNQKTQTGFRLVRRLRWSGWLCGVVAMICPVALCFPQAAAPNSWAYVGPQYIITAEAAGAYSFVLNFINLTDFVIVVQPSEFIYKGSSGRFYVGQVFDHESKDNRGETFKYSASILLKGHSFTGLTALGAFHEQDTIDELSVRIGAKRFYLVPLEKVEFEQLAARIGELDLESASPRAALQGADLNDMGTVKTTDGTSDWDRDWQGLLQPDGLNFPKIVARPPVQPTEEARKTHTYGKVKLSALITRNGGIEDLRVERGLGRGLDERAMESVRNSWVFLPATKNGEVLEGRVAFEVDFPAPPKQ